MPSRLDRFRDENRVSPEQYEKAVSLLRDAGIENDENVDFSEFYDPGTETFSDRLGHRIRLVPKKSANPVPGTRDAFARWVCTAAKAADKEPRKFVIDAATVDAVSLDPVLAGDREDPIVYVPHCHATGVENSVMRRSSLWGFLAFAVKQNESWPLKCPGTAAPGLAKESILFEFEPSEGYVELTRGSAKTVQEYIDEILLHKTPEQKRLADRLEQLSSLEVASRPTPYLHASARRTRPAPPARPLRPPTRARPPQSVARLRSPPPAQVQRWRRGERGGRARWGSGALTIGLAATAVIAALIPR